MIGQVAAACALAIAICVAAASPADAQGAGAGTAERAASPFYAGVGVSSVHHTGYLPDSSAVAPPPGFGGGYNVEAYALGGKVFGGYQINPLFRVEAAFHDLGRASFGSVVSRQGALLRIVNTEESFALAGSVIYVTPELSRWVPPLGNTNLLFRVGLAYKDIHQTSGPAKFSEGALAAVVGVSIEHRITPTWFGRLEYEHIGTALTGPSETVPELRGLIHVDLGGTRNVVNVMHTPLSVSIGHNF
jgi:hypothetical protein